MLVTGTDDVDEPALYLCLPEQTEEVHSLEGIHKSAEPVSKSQINCCGGVPILSEPAQSVSPYEVRDSEADVAVGVGEELVVVVVVVVDEPVLVRSLKRVRLMVECVDVDDGVVLVLVRSLKRIRLMDARPIGFEPRKP